MKSPSPEKMTLRNEPWDSEKMTSRKFSHSLDFFRGLHFSWFPTFQGPGRVHAANYLGCAHRESGGGEEEGGVIYTDSVGHLASLGGLADRRRGCLLLRLVALLDALTASSVAVAPLCPCSQTLCIYICTHIYKRLTQRHMCSGCGRAAQACK